MKVSKCCQSTCWMNYKDGKTYCLECFKECERIDKPETQEDIAKYGVSISKNGKRIDPNSVFIETKEEDWKEELRQYGKICGTCAFQKGCHENDELNNFIQKLLSSQKQKILEELKENITLFPKTCLDETDNEDTYEEGYEQCIDDILSLLNNKPKE